MKLETENRLIEEGVTEEDVLRVFNDDEERGGFVILTSDDGSVLQAAGKGRSPFTLEFYPEADAPRYQQATQLNKDQVRAAFVDFFHGRTAWRSSFEWREVSERKGCLPAILILGGVILGPVIGSYLFSGGGNG